MPLNFPHTLADCAMMKDTYNGWNSSQRSKQFTFNGIFTLLSTEINIEKPLLFYYRI
jgi:hypothetical protein